MGGHPGPCPRERGTRHSSRGAGWPGTGPTGRGSLGATPLPLRRTALRKEAWLSAHQGPATWPLLAPLMRRCSVDRRVHRRSVLSAYHGPAWRTVRSLPWDAVRPTTPPSADQRVAFFSRSSASSSMSTKVRKSSPSGGSPTRIGGGAVGHPNARTTHRSLLL